MYHPSSNLKQVPITLHQFAANGSKPKESKKLSLIAASRLVMFFGLFGIQIVGTAQSILNDFGTGSGALSTNNTSSTSLIPNPSVGAATTYARVASGSIGGSVNVDNTRGVPLGCDSYLRAVASSGANVTKASPVVSASSAASQAYVKFNIELGSSTGANTVTSGTWSMFMGNGAMYSNTGDFSANETFAGLRFGFANSGVINSSYLDGSSWTSFTSNIAQGTNYTIELFLNNSGSSISYNYNGGQSVANNRMDIWVNGTRVANDVRKGNLGGGTSLNSLCFIGNNSTGNAANIFVDDLEIFYSIPSNVFRSTVAVSTPGVAASNITQGAQSVILQTYAFNPTSADALLNSITVTTAGNYQANDITALEAVLSTNSTLDAGDLTLQTLTSPGTAGNKTFNFACQSIPSGATYYLFITADIPCTAVANRTISISSTNFANIQFVDSNETGTNPVSAGGTKTIVAATSASISTQPSSVSACIGGPLNLSVTASGTGLSYQWRKGGTNISGANSATYSVSNAAVGDAGSYDVIVSGQCGSSITSSTATVTISTPPSAPGTITGNTSLCQGVNNVSYTVPAVSGAANYTWSYSGTGATISGTTNTVSINFSSTATSGNLTVTANNTCGSSNASSALSVTIGASPFVNNITSSLCTGSSVTVTPTNGTNGTIPSGTTFTWPLPSGTGFTGATASASPSTSLTQTLTNTGASAATATYTLTPTVGSCVGSAFTVTITVNPRPSATITADYCSAAGSAILTVPSGATYAWSNGATASSISVNTAGTYSVNVTNGFGCTNSSSIAVAQELVVNGNFEQGNTGFTTGYTFRSDLYTGGNTGLIQEGTYGINSNANATHPGFWGRDHTSGNGNFMIINSSGAMATIWAMNGVTVQPNTTYYFSAYAMSVNNGAPFAQLRFSINGSQVGTVATLTAGPTNNSGPFNWVQFYGQWNSGPATSADISIVNLQTALGGNDFGLDDISFGTLSPTLLDIAPLANGGTGTCLGSTLQLTSNITGGMSPFTYAWTGPNGFTSSSANPTVINSATSAQAGTYNLTVTDGGGCTQSTSFAVAVNALPNDVTATAASSSVCSGTSTNVVIASSETGIYYQLCNAANDATIGSEVLGTGGSINLPTGNLTSAITFKIRATRYTTGCSRTLTSQPTVNVSTTPVLTLTNQNVCSGSVNLTAASVTAGSTGGGTLSYWTNAAGTTSLANPTAVTTAGTYWIRSTLGSCSDIEPVSVFIGTTSGAAFSYTGSPFCTSGTNPAPVFTGSNVAGTFTSTSGLVFEAANTGRINLAASTPGTYTITNTVSPTGGCSSSTATTTVTITRANNATFSYTSNGLCQAANANNPAPIFAPGAVAGTFSSTAGVTFVSTSTGVINLGATTPGNYAIVNTVAANAGCPAVTDTVFVDINPYTFDGSVSASASVETLCEGSSLNLFSSATGYLTVLERERFNGSINNWVTANNSTGGTPSAAAWTLRGAGYSINGTAITSNDATQCYISDARSQGSGNTSTWLRSPALSSVGFTTLSLDFFHFYDDRNATDNCRVQISTNGSSWTDLATYTSDQGSNNNFTNAVISLNSYIGLPQFFIRFLYTANGGDRYWCIDNVSITGMSTNYTYSWASSPSGFTSALQNPTGVTPTASTFYVATAMNAYGCSVPAIPVGVTLNPRPADNAGADVTTCVGTPVGIGAAAASGRTYSWSPSTALSSSTASNPTAAPTSTTTYSLTETITATGCSATNNVVVTVRPVPAINNLNANICNGGTFTVTPANGSNGTVPSGTTYTWTAPTGTGFSGGSAQTTAQSNISQTLTLTGQSAAQATYVVTPTANGCAGAPFNLQVNVNANTAITSQPVSPGPLCLNNSTATLTVVASGQNLSYQWRKGTTNLNNNSLYSGATSASLTITNPALADAGNYFVMVSGQCGNFVTSTTIPIVVNSPVTPTISVSSANGTSVCEGTGVTFNSSITNGGSTPTYLWRVNGTPVAGANSSSFIKSDLQDGDVVSCGLTSSNSCVTSSTAISSGITMTINPYVTPDIEISTPAASGLCSGTPVTFTATPTNGGSSPTYQWKRNGVNVGTNSQNLTITNMSNTDIVSCVLTSNQSCITQNNLMSNSISLNVQNNAAPAVAITSENSGNACPGSAIIFTANAANAGAMPSYRWLVNGEEVGTNSPTYSSTTLNAGDQVTCTVISALSCASPESVNSTPITVAYSGAIMYYPDTDEDGYGATTGGVNSCTPMVGYVTNNFDCNDANIDINPGTDEWYNGLDDNCDTEIDENGGGTRFYRDNDNDNYGNPSDTIRSFSLPAGYCLHDGDCDDNNALVNPLRAEICNGIDDDCDGTIDEGCGPLNDEPSTSLSLSMPNFPECFPISGTLSGATTGSSGNGATTIGADVWYRFVAPHPGVRVQVFSTTNDIAIELRNMAGVVLKTENSQGVGNEILNFGGLTPGETYLVGVRNLNSGTVPGGAFTICGNALRASYFTASNGTYSLCDNVNAFYTIANQYTVRYTNTATNVSNVFNTASNSTLIPLSNCVGLTWGASYSVRVDAVYSLTRGNGNVEVITVQGTVLRNITIASSAVTSVRTSDICPNVKLLASTLTLNSWICGAVDYQWEFTRTLPSSANAVVVMRGTSSTILPLSMVPGLTANSTYTVRVRGILPNNVLGAWSTAQCVTIGGSTALEILPADDAVNQQHSLRTKRDEEDEGMSFYLFPNPSDGTTVYLNIENMTAPNFTVRITDQTGRIVYSQPVQATGNMRLALNLEGQISSGSYQLEILMNNSFKVKRLIVVDKH